jgi:serine/threonine protein kinase
VYDHFSDEDGWYLVMEFVDGRDLASWPYAGAPGAQAPVLQQVLAAGIQLADALAYLHGHDPVVVHRDVKPSNAVVTPQGRVVLIDLGIACVLAPGDAGRVLFGGSQMFCAPEQEQEGWSSPQGDLYSLGVTLSFLLASSPSPAETVPEALLALLSEMTQQDPRQRVRSAVGVSQELRRILESVLGEPCDDARVRALLASPRVAYRVRGETASCALGQSFWYLFRPASKSYGRLDVLAKVIGVSLPAAFPSARIAFTHPHTGREELRWLPPLQMWRLSSLE